MADDQVLTSIRVLARGSDGQMFSYAWDDIPSTHMAETMRDAVETMRDRENTWYPAETFKEDERALFQWRHTGWGQREDR